MRVAYLLTQDRGGPVDVTVRLAATLHAQGHDVMVFGPLPARGAELVASMHVPLAVDRKGDLKAIRSMRAALRAWRPDIVHAQDRRAGLATAGMQLAPSGPPAVVHTYHGVPEDVEQPWFAGDSGATPPSRYTRAVLAADAVVARTMTTTVVPATAMGTFLRKRLRVPARRITHIDNGIELPAAPEPLRGPVRRLLFVGLLTPRKGLHDLLDALEQPGALLPDATLSVAGDGPERESLERRVAAGPLRGRVRFLGFRTDVPALLEHHDALVLPSRMEQQPLVIAEAMGTGRPVVATAVGGVAEMVAVDSAARLVVPPRDPAALAAVVRSLQELPDPAVLGSALRDRAEASYSEHACAAAHVGLYEAILAARFGRRGA